MEKQLLSEIIEMTRELMDAQTCNSETKAAAQRWLNAVGTDAEKAENKRYIDELEAAIMPIDTLISFAQSNNGVFRSGHCCSDCGSCKRDQGGRGEVL